MYVQISPHSLVEETMNLYRSNKNFSKMTGAYEITFKSGNSYVGKGGLKRAITSAKNKSNDYMDDVVDIKWISAKNKHDAFIKEHILMEQAKFEEKVMYNKISSLGKKYFLEKLLNRR